MREESPLWKATILLGMATLLTRATNFLTQMVIAHHFGVNLDADAYFLVENGMLIAGSFLITSFSVAFIPIWTNSHIHEGPRAANRFHYGFVVLATAASLGLSVVVGLVGFAFSSLLLQSGVDPLLQATGRLMLVASPAVALMGFTVGCTSILQANRHFLIPELGNISYNLVLLVAALFFAARLGMISLAWATVLAAVVRLLVQVPASRKISSFQTGKGDQSAGLGLVQKRVLPIFAAYAGTQVTLLLGNLMASNLPAGSVSALVYASRVMLLPVGILVLPLQTTILPTLSQQVAHKDLRLLGKTMLDTFRMLVLVGIPISVGIVFLRLPLVQLLYQRGAFDAAASALTADLLAFFALGLPAVALLMLINSVYCAMGDMQALVLVNGFHWAATALLGAVLVRVAGASGAAMSISISTTLACVLGLARLKKSIPTFKLNGLVEVVAKSAIASGVMFLLLTGANLLMTQGLKLQLTWQWTEAVLQIVLAVLLGGSSFTIAAWLLKIDEFQVWRERMSFSKSSLRIRAR